MTELNPIDLRFNVPGVRNQATELKSLLTQFSEQHTALLKKQEEEEKKYGANVGAIRARYLKQHTDLEKQQHAKLATFRKQQAEKSVADIKAVEDRLNVSRKAGLSDIRQSIFQLEESKRKMALETAFTLDDIRKKELSDTTKKVNAELQLYRSLEKEKVGRTFSEQFKNIIGQSGLPGAGIISGGALGIGAAGAGSIVLFKQLGEAGIKANERIEKLKVGLQSTGTSAAFLDGRLKGLITSTYSLSNVFGVNNHSLQEATAHFLELGGKSDDLQRKQQAIILLAEKGGKSLEEAATYAVKGFDEDLNLKLTRFGIYLDKTLPPAEQFNQFMRQGAPLLAALKEKAEGVSGDLNRMTNEFDRAKDGAGLLVLQGIRPLIQGFNWLMEARNAQSTGEDNYNEAIKSGKIPQESFIDRLSKIGLLFTGNYATSQRLNAEYHNQVEASINAASAIIRHSEAVQTDRQKQDELNRSIEKHIKDTEADAKDSTDSIIKRIAARTIENRQYAENAKSETGINKGILEAAINKNNRLNESDKIRGKELVKIYSEIENETHLASLGIGAAVDTKTPTSKATLENPLKAAQTAFELHGMQLNYTKEQIEIGLLNIQIKYDNLIAEQAKKGSNTQVEFALDAAKAMQRIREINYEVTKRDYEKSIKEENIHFEFLISSANEADKKRLELNKKFVKEAIDVEGESLNEIVKMYNDAWEKINKDEVDKFLKPQEEARKRYREHQKAEAERLAKETSKEIQSAFDSTSFKIMDRVFKPIEDSLKKDKSLIGDIANDLIKLGEKRLLKFIGEKLFPENKDIAEKPEALKNRDALMKHESTEIHANIAYITFDKWEAKNNAGVSTGGIDPTLVEQLKLTKIKPGAKFSVGNNPSMSREEMASLYAGAHKNDEEGTIGEPEEKGTLNMKPDVFGRQTDESANKILETGESVHHVQMALELLGGKALHINPLMAALTMATTNMSGVSDAWKDTQQAKVDAEPQRFTYDPATGKSIDSTTKFSSNADITGQGKHAAETTGLTIANTLLKEGKKTKGKGVDKDALKSLMGVGLSLIPGIGGVASDIFSSLQFQYGGVVPQYFEFGGKAKNTITFPASTGAHGRNPGGRGTDTVPAWLTPGEEVLREDDPRHIDNMMRYGSSGLSSSQSGGSSIDISALHGIGRETNSLLKQIANKKSNPYDDRNSQNQSVNQSLYGAY